MVTEAIPITAVGLCGFGPRMPLAGTATIGIVKSDGAIEGIEGQRRTIEAVYRPRMAIAGGIAAARKAGQITANWLRPSTMTAPAQMNSGFMRERAI